MCTAEHLKARLFLAAQHPLTPQMSQSDRIDEETPLIPSKPTATPLPWGQFYIVLLIQMAEPLTAQVINPFAPQVRLSFCGHVVYFNGIHYSSSLFETLESRMGTKRRLGTMLESWYVFPGLLRRFHC
jgi:hypothetical protein